jgi:hypothetical protein
MAATHTKKFLATSFVDFMSLETLFLSFFSIETLAASLVCGFWQPDLVGVVMDLQKTVSIRISTCNVRSKFSSRLLQIFGTGVLGTFGSCLHDCIG